MPDQAASDALRQLARRMESKCDFFAHRLARQRKKHGLTEDGQAHALGISAFDLVRLAICRIPRVGQHLTDLALVSQFCGIEVAALQFLLTETKS